MHHDPKPKDSDSEDDASVERKKPEGSWFPPQREKGPANTSDVSCAQSTAKITEVWNGPKFSLTNSRNSRTSCAASCGCHCC